MRCAGPAAAAIAAPALMGQGAAASSTDYAAGSGKPFSVEQMAGSENRSKAARTPNSDVNGTLRRVMIYRWAWDNDTSGPKFGNYSRDGCTRWYPGAHFVRQWDCQCEEDPGMAGSLEHNAAELRADISASGTKASMIGLMADDIEAIPGYDRRTKLLPDELQERSQFRDAIAGRLI
eukprot:8192806-Heterocapsa_arctica.AAC.1